LNRVPPVIVRVADIAPVPWRNGGGVTRELLAWPDPKDWLLRVSVAEIRQSGAFSEYPGVDRWFAVLEGGAVRLATAGTEATELTASHPELHAFSGDAATHCTALGAETRDFNLMARRSRVRLLQQSVQRCPRLGSCAEGVGLFVVQATELRQDDAPAHELPNMALAWWPNPRRVPLALQLASTGLRGWWFEIDTDPGSPS
jgi:uncharacterized protein